MIGRRVRLFSEENATGAPTFAVPAEPWMGDALCPQVGLDMFYGEGNDPSRLQAAKQVCSLCPVQAECLEYAITNNEEWGVWGGVGPRERRYLRSPRGSFPKPLRDTGHGWTCKCSACGVSA